MFSETKASGAENGVSTATGSLAALLAGVFWGLSGCISMLSPAGINPLSFAALRLQSASLLLFLVFKGRKSIKPAEILPLLTAGILMVMVQFFFFSAIPLSGIGASTMIFIGSTPIFGGIFEALIYRMALKRRWITAAVLSLSGCLILSLPGLGEPSFLKGSLLALGAGASWAGAGLAMKNIQKNRSALGATFFTIACGGLLLLPIHFIHPPSWILSFSGASSLLALGLLATALPYVLFNISIRSIKASHAYILAMTEPLTAAILGILLFNEALSLVNATGYLLILSGIVVLSIKTRKKRI